MERLDFASVMAVLRRNIPDENFGNQADFLESLFLDLGFNPQTAMEFDQGQVCRWINGLARLGPTIISFYQEKENQWKLVRRIKERVLPLMPDSAMASTTTRQASRIKSKVQAEMRLSTLAFCRSFFKSITSGTIFKQGISWAM